MPSDTAANVFDYAKLARLRRASGLSAEQFCVKAGLSFPYLWRLETGGNDPSLALVGRLAAALGINPGELLRPAEPSTADPAPLAS